VTSHIEGVWGELKRISAIYSSAIPSKYAQNFVDEFCFRRDIEIQRLDAAEQLAQIINI